MQTTNLSHRNRKYVDAHMEDVFNGRNELKKHPYIANGRSKKSITARNVRKVFPARINDLRTVLI